MEFKKERCFKSMISAGVLCYHSRCQKKHDKKRIFATKKAAEAMKSR